MNPAPSKQNLKKLREFFQETAPLCVHEPAGMLKHRYVTPTYSVIPGADDNLALAERSATGSYLQMYDWDACFFSQAVYRVELHGLEEAVVANFLSLMDLDGHIPRTVSPNRIWDSGDQCKPFLAQTLLSLHQRKRGVAEAGCWEEFLPGIERYLGYFEKNRIGQFGLYTWRNALESGVDDNLALIAPREAAKDEDSSISCFPDGEILGVDLNSYLAKEYQALAQLAEHCNLGYLKERAQKKHDAMVAAIEAHLWNEEMGVYCGFNPRENRAVSILSWTNLTPVIMFIAQEEHAHRVIQNIILNREHFLRPFGLASQALSEPLTNQQRRGLYGRAIVSNWQGPVWVLPNALIIRALLKYGYVREAEELSISVLGTLCRSLERFGTLYENYNSETGEPLWAPKFMSWNILALELLELVGE